MKFGKFIARYVIIDITRNSVLSLLSVCLNSTRVSSHDMDNAHCPNDLFNLYKEETRQTFVSF